MWPAPAISAYGAPGQGLRRTSTTLADQLARALNYRRWHRFRVERWQDGSWRKLSGRSSSGERALGFTVPPVRRSRELLLRLGRG